MALATRTALARNSQTDELRAQEQNGRRETRLVAGTALFDHYTGLTQPPSMNLSILVYLYVS